MIDRFRANAENELEEAGQVEPERLREDFKKSFDELFSEVLKDHPTEAGLIQYCKGLFWTDMQLKLESVIDRVQIMQRLRRWKDMTVEDLDEGEENQQYDENEEDE